MSDVVQSKWEGLVVVERGGAGCEVTDIRHNESSIHACQGCDWK